VQNNDSELSSINYFPQCNLLCCLEVHFLYKEWDHYTAMTLSTQPFSCKSDSQSDGKVRMKLEEI